MFASYLQVWIAYAVHISARDIMQMCTLIMRCTRPVPNQVQRAKRINMNKYRCKYYIIRESAGNNT